MLMSRHSYREIKKQERSWKKAKKKIFSQGRRFLPLSEYIARKNKRNEIRYNLETVYISGEHIGKIEDAPVFWKETMTSHLYRRYTATTKKGFFVRHLPRQAIKVSVDKDWWGAKFGVPG